MFGTPHLVSNMDKMLSVSSLIFLLSAIPLAASEPSSGTLIMLGSAGGWVALSSVFLCLKRRKKPEPK